MPGARPHRQYRAVQVVIESSSISLLVGPEGGFSDAEMEQIQAAGIDAVKLGPRVLRTETAGPAAIALLQATAGDF